MKTYQNIYRDSEWRDRMDVDKDASLVMAFGGKEALASSDRSAEIQKAYPNADIIGCTTSGEILGSELYDDTLCLTAMSFDNTQTQVASLNLEGGEVYDAAKNLAGQLDFKGLRYVMVVSDGQQVNGTELVNGLKHVLPEGVLITGGLAGDGTRFEETIVRHNARAESGLIVVCGFYGDSIKIGHGSIGGWDSFGPERRVTKSSKNVLYTLDNEPALGLYKQYLGDYSKELPSSALLFPLLVKPNDQSQPVIRTVLNVDDSDNSMTFAGDMPEGATAQLMRANFDRLIDGAESAAENALATLQGGKRDSGLVMMISCVGRRLVLKQRIEEELEAVSDVFGDQWQYTGFYSYGEISPIVESEDSCALHNQTMTITAIREE